MRKNYIHLISLFAKNVIARNLDIYTKQVLGRDPEFVYVDEFGRNVSRWQMFKAIVIDPLETVLDVDWRDFFPYLKWVPNKSLEDKITKVCQKRDAIVNALISEERQLLANGKVHSVLFLE